ncbi:MAG: DUF4192 domain-containing protein [Jatrophihabitantaceae bacterium]
MTTSDPPAIRVSSPADLIEAVPYLLGFHPAESLVVIGFDGAEAVTRQITVTARLDIGPDGADPVGLRSLVQVLGRSDSGAVAAVLLTDRLAGDPRRQPWLTDIMSALVAELASVELPLLDALAATGSRWWSLCCAQLDCCPPEGRPRSSASSTVAAEATFAGLVALPDRQALLASLDGASVSVRAALLPALRRADHRFAELAARDGLRRTRRGERAAVLRAAGECQAGLRLSPRRLARLGVALRDVEIRDAIWLGVDDRSLNAEELLGQLHSRLPPPYLTAPLFLFGWQLWRSGSGTLAAMAAERALQSDPEYSAARLLLEAVEAGMDPRSTPPLAGGRTNRLPV